MTTENLIIAAKLGDSDAFSQLINELNLYPRLRGFLQSKFWSLSDEDVADLIQEVLLTAHQKLYGLITPSSFISWCFTTAYRKGSEFYRKQVEHTSIDEIAEDISDPQDQLSQWIQAEQRAELWELIKGCFSTPTEKQWFTALCLHYRERRTVSEIAVMLGVAEGTVKAWLSRARTHLKKCHEKGLINLKDFFE